MNFQWFLPFQLPNHPQKASISKFQTPEMDGGKSLNYFLSSSPFLLICEEVYYECMGAHVVLSGCSFVRSFEHTQFRLAAPFAVSCVRSRAELTRSTYRQEFCPLKSSGTKLLLVAEEPKWFCCFHFFLSSNSARARKKGCAPLELLLQYNTDKIRGQTDIIMLHQCPDLVGFPLALTERWDAFLASWQ